MITIYWRDIPAQVTARDGRRKASVQLDDRFQVAIDRAAAVAGKETTDDYLAEWHRVTADTPGADLQAEVEEAAEALETAFPEQRLQRFVLNGGNDPDGDGSDTNDSQ